MARIPRLQTGDALSCGGRFASALLSLALLGGCVATTSSVKTTPIRYAQTELPEAQLLDVGIELFASPPAGEGDKADAYNPEIRDAEARFLPYQLKATLQPTGYWGAVDVIPNDAVVTDVYVTGNILRSNGKELRVEIGVRDSTGRSWFTRGYETEVDEHAYVQASEQGRDPFQDFYNALANDLLQYRQRLSPRQLTSIRRVSRLRFAAELAPDAFANYLHQDPDGNYRVRHLPSAEDPMMQRVERMRDRDFMLIDTINAHYREFHDEMRDPYLEWRESYLKELKAKRKLEQDAWGRRALGVAAIAAAIANELFGGRRRSHVATGLLVYGGVQAFQSGSQVAESARIHADAIEELNDSFGAEISPVVMEVEGHSVRLTGSAEEQYRAWRRTMHEMFLDETGFEAADPPVTQTAGP